MHRRATDHELISFAVCARQAVDRRLALAAGRELKHAVQLSVPAPSTRHRISSTRRCYVTIKADGSEKNSTETVTPK